MAGGILQLVANNGAAQNLWLDHDPQITFFKCLYRRHTPFAMETVPLQFKSKLDFGRKAQLTLLPIGDLVHRIYLTFEIPRLAAAFLNTKSEDVSKIIHSMPMSDDSVKKQLLGYVLRSNQIEFDNIFELVDSKLNIYQKEADRLLRILNKIRKAADPDGTNGLVNISHYLPNNMENDFYFLKQQYHLVIGDYDFQKYKMYLADIWMNENKELFPIYELVKLIYLLEKRTIDNLPLTDTRNLTNSLLYYHIFNELIPNREILLMQIVGQNNVDNLLDTINEVDNKIMQKSAFAKEYQQIYGTYPIIPTSVSLPGLDTYRLYQYALSQNLSINELFYDFGPAFYQILNSYHTIINVLNTLANTIPIVLVKVFAFSQKNNYNIYQDKLASALAKTYYPTVTDPNFRASFMASVNHSEKDIDTAFMPINILGKNEPIYPNYVINEYLDFFNSQANAMFLNYQSSIDAVFERYRNFIFVSTDKLFFHHSVPLTNIYGYFAPEQGYQDNSGFRIPNVFNANIYYFYFFKYLDMLDETSFVNYVKNHSFPKMTSNGEKIMKNLITLLKINLEYYMNEISYLANDLYASSPSTNPNDSMKNYVPPSNGDNNMLAVTLIFHRNQIPSILEMFQYIYYFIDDMDIDRINNYLDLNLVDIEPNEMIRIRRTVKLLYSRIFKHFMDVYDSFYFEAPANFSINPFSQEDDIAIGHFASHFLQGTGKNYGQIGLSYVLPQMEFYFVVEMFHMRQTQKFYHNILSNQQLISEKVGSGTAQILQVVYDTLVSLDDNFVPDRSNNVGDYWDQMYRHNVDNGKKDKLYYVTFNSNRYSGESYLNTPYQSRNYGIIDQLPLLPPDPLPPTDPYGINPSYYSHLTTNLPIHWNTVHSNRLNFQDNENHFPLYDIDYFRIRHDVFSRPTFRADRANSVDILLLNLLMLLKLTKKLGQIYPIYEKYLLQWLSIIVYYLVKNISPDTAFLQESVPQILHDYLGMLEQSIDQNKITIPIDFLEKVQSMTMFLISQYQNGVIISIYHPSKPYRANDLVENNWYTYQVINSDSPIMEKIDTMKNNFISQYYYYSLHSKDINRISQISKNFLFSSTGQILEEILGFPKISTFAYIYPDAFERSLREIVGYQKKMDDFQQYLFGSVTTILKINRPGKATIRDVLDMLNLTFWAVGQINRYLIDKRVMSVVLPKLAKYQTKLLRKIVLLDEINSYLSNLPKNKFLTDNDIIHLSKLGEKYGVDQQSFYQYLLKFGEEYNNATRNYQIHYRDLVLLNRFRTTLDPFILKNYDPNTTFKQQIIQDIFQNDFGDEHPNLKYYFNFIDNEYYAYIYFYLTYAQKNGILTASNPLMFYDENTLTNDWNTIEKYYCSFGKVGDLFHYLIDYLMDYGILGENPFSEKNQLGYGKRFSIMTNDICLIPDMDPSKTIIGVLEQTNDPGYFKILDKKVAIRELTEDVIQRRILWTNKLEEELKAIHDKLATIMYRNKRAKTAWVRKLAHFLVKEVAVFAEDIPIDKHISDWFEAYHQISKDSGGESGYLKMIGHREDLIIFDDKPKKSYQIVMPFIFYFNKYVSASLPLNASINTKYQITVKLRDLEDVAYKEEFSEFVDSGMNPISPKLSNPQLMVEYIYLSNEERKIFSTTVLEYLMDELQYDDTVTINDNNMEPVYYVDNTKPGKNHARQVVEETKNDLDKNILAVNLIPRNDYQMEKYRDRSGIERFMMVYQPLPINPYIHKKRTQVENYFHNPSKLMIVLFKPIEHTDSTLRTWKSSYFYGEKQWDNYGLYPYYNLNKINQAKEIHYKKIKSKLLDLEDPDFGFMAVINQLLLQYADKPMEGNSDYDKWIASHFEYFQETLQTIKDAYHNYHGEIINGMNQLRLKENIMTLAIDYPIRHAEVLERIVSEILDELGITVPLENLPNTNSDREELKNLVSELLSNYLSNATIQESDINQVVNEIYDDYNESQINTLVLTINQLLHLENIPYHMEKIVNYSYQLYLADPESDPDILEILGLVCQSLDEMNSQEKEMMNNRQVNLSTYRDVISQILGAANIIVPYRVLSIVSSKISEKINQIVDQYPVNIIDYRKNLVENPKINPLVSGYLKFNDVAIMPENFAGIMWSDGQGYQYLAATPETGINIRSWSLDPLSYQPQGSANLSRIDKFVSVYHIHPLVGDHYPANILTMILSQNIIRFMSGMVGKAWVPTKN